MSRDKRRQPRIDFHLPIMIKGHKKAFKVLDFSLVGLFIETDNPAAFKPREEIDVFMKLPHRTTAIQVKARVVRSTGEGIGVEFFDLTPKNAMILESCFSIFKHTVPLPGT